MDSIPAPSSRPTPAMRVPSPTRHQALLGVATMLLLPLLSAFAAGQGLWKVFAIAWTAFGAMALGAVAATLIRPSRRGLVWGYGLASGAMLTSAALDLVPLGVRLDPRLAGVGLAAGLILGYVLDKAGQSSTSGAIDPSTLRLTAHALTAGLAVGSVYAMMPGIGLLLGLAIVSHKGPAGYAAARHLVNLGKSPAVLVLPAAGLGIAALAVSLVQPSVPAVVNALIVGVSAGVFVHFAIDFLPHATRTAHTVHHAYPTGEHYAEPGGVRVQGALSTLLGAGIVAAAWFAIT